MCQLVDSLTIPLTQQVVEVTASLIQSCATNLMWMHLGEIAYIIINVTSYKMSAVIKLLEYSLCFYSYYFCLYMQLNG